MVYSLYSDSLSGSSLVCVLEVVMLDSVGDLGGGCCSTAAPSSAGATGAVNGGGGFG